MANVNDLLNQATRQPTAPDPQKENRGYIFDGTKAWGLTQEQQDSPVPFDITYTKEGYIANNAAGKKAGLIAAAESKVKAMSPEWFLQNSLAARTGQGADSATPQELDIQNMNPVALYARYGRDATSLLAGSAQGDRQITQAEGGNRSLSQLNDDAGLALLGGLTGSVGGLASLATGLVDENAGTALAGQVTNALDFLNSQKTQQLQARTQINEAKNALDNRDNYQQWQKDKATDGDFLAGLKRVGRDAVSSVKNASSDSSILADGTINALGSFLAAGPVSKAAKVLTAGRAGTAVAIGGLEAGGSYQQSASDIMKKDFSTLEKDSPYYRDLIAQGLSPEEARVRVADRTGVLGAAITAPFAVAAGRLVHKFEGNPLALGSGKQLAGNVARETIEEGTQGGTGQLAQNYAASQLSDQNQSLSEGVGRQIGEGALYGMGMASALGAPSAAKTAISGTAQAVGKKVANAFEQSAATQDTANKQASPIADAKIQQAATEAQATAPQAAEVMKNAVEATDATPAQKSEANSYVDKLVTANNFDMNAEDVPAIVKPHMEGVSNRVEAIQRTAEVVNSAEAGSNDQLRAGFYLHQLVSGYADIINSDPEAFQKIPEDHQAKQIVGQYASLMGAIQNTPKVMEAIGKIQDALDKHSAPQVEINEATLATPQGQQDVQDAISTSSIAPDKANLATTEQILFHAAQGRIQITPQQKAALDTSVALLRATKAADEEAKRLGQTDPVSLNIRSVDGEKGQSVLQHAQGIMSAWKSGDRNLAADRLVQLQNFAQSMANKAAGLQSHFAAGNPKADRVSFKAYANGEFYDSKTKLGVVPTNERSVEFIQKVTSEARLLADVTNGMVDAFPDLGGKHIQVAPLDAQLVGPAKDVAARFRAVSTQTSTPATSIVQPAAQVAPKTEAAPVAKEAPKVSEPVVKETPVAAEPTAKTTEASQPTAPQKVTETTPAQAPVAEAKGMAAVYPKLLGGAKNYFNKVFKLPTEQRTRTISDESPLQTIQDALKNSAAFTAFLGSAPKGEYSPELATAYRDYLSLGQDIAASLDDNLQEFLNADGLREKVLNGTEVNRFLVGKALNITEVHNGEVVYNPELIENAVLAGLQWLLSASQYGTTLDSRDVAEMTGLNDEAVSDSLVTALNQGLSVLEAKRSMAQKIRSYWGVQNNPDGGIGYQEGIPEAVASEIIRVMMDNGALVEQRVMVTEADGAPFDKPYIRLVQPHTLRDEKTGKFKDDPFAAMRPMPNAIDTAVLVKPEETLYVGEGNIPPVATDQLRNPGVKNTPQQLESIKNEQSTPYYVNPFMAGLYRAMGKDNVLSLFGAGPINKEVMNVNHAASLEGVNQQTVSAFDHLSGLLANIQNQGEIDQVPVHYAFNMTRVARLQMLGKYNPQSNKMVREAILPTRSTLDLTTGKDLARFNLGLAQALGVKVHKMFPARSTRKVLDMLTGPLAPAVKALGNWASTFDKANTLTPVAPLSSAVINTLTDSFKAAGEPLTPMALHAVMEYARTQNGTDLTKFNTSLYVEADGVTNGPINAMVLLTSGMFTSDWIRNIAKGGLFFNRPNESVNSNVENGDDRDLYQATTDRLKHFLEAQRASFADNPMATEQMDHLFTLMDMFLGGDLQFDGNTLTLQRGIAKNPLTITIYGSGAGGIASKMVKAITDEIYTRMSQVASAQANGATSLADAMFGPQSVSLEDARAKAAKFTEAYTNLVTKRAYMAKGKLLFKTEVAPEREFNPVTFTFDKTEIKNMTSNMLHMFVTPMRDAIEETVGQPLSYSADLLRKATQVQSIYMQYSFKAAVEAKLEEKAKADPEWKKTEFLSNKELDDVRKSLGHMAPNIETPTQTFYVAGSQSTDLNLVEFSRALNGKLRSDGFVNGPMNSGVSGIPFMNIGTGDGQMMQNISTDPNAPTGTLKIFDGMNMPLDQVESGSLVANKAVFDSWMGNPLKAVADSYTKFMADTKLDITNDKQREELSQALFGLAKKDATVEEITSAMQDMIGAITAAHQSVEARHNVMRSVDLSIDQMAAGNTPYQNKGTNTLTGTDPESLAEQLNALYNTELAKITKSAPTPKLNESILSLAQKHESGAYVMYGNDLVNLASKLPAEQAAVVNEVIGSLAAQDYKLVWGSPEVANQYNQIEGLPGMGAAPAGEVHGYTDVGSKTIYMFNPTSETMVHELVHAASFETAAAHYAGVTTPSVTKAVGNLENLMGDFLELGTNVSHANDTMLGAFDSATAAIRGYLSQGTAQGKAAGLNEFMAWALSNESLIRMLQRTEVSRLARMKDAVINGIKSLLGIKANVGKDLFSNLLFNSSILMHSQPSLSQRFTAGSLFQNSIYGDNDRLSTINEALTKSIGRYLNEGPKAGKIDPTALVQTGIMMSYRIGQSFMAHGFPMSMQEASTFHTIIAALATEAKIDPNALSAVQQLYTHALKNLSVESFMTNPESQDPNEYAAAKEKYDVLLGRYLAEADAKGRSTLLPSFLALATVNEGFRSILEKIDLPKSADNTAGTFDALLENMGTKMMDSLGNRMSGLGNKATNVQQAIDLLNARIADEVNKRETFIDQMASKSGGLIDRANDLVMAGMDRLSKSLLGAATRAQRNGAGKLQRAATGVGAAVAAVINEGVAQRVAVNTMTAVNKTNMWEPMATLINDLIGRTESNANIYDKIKTVRSTVQQTRQQFREHLPQLIAEKFSKDVTDAEWSTMHTAMGKADMAALRNGFSNDEIFGMLTDSSKLDSHIKDLETSIKALDPVHFANVQKKMKQLAHYMLTGEVGSNLLRNAETVSNLFSEHKRANFAKKTGDYVASVDKLISMYALRNLDSSDKATMSELAKSEQEGLGFTLSYLVGQRGEEYSKATTPRARVNMYKGYIPSETQVGTHVIVADDSEYANLVKKSYIRVGDYGGSSLESGLNKGYYFSPVAARPTFEQGIMQNVRQTANGVDATTGHTVGQNAGVIADRTTVQKLAARMATEKGNEPLVPVYNETGDVVAFERSLDPEQMVRVSKDSHLAKMIGQWRGRQVEEAMASKLNESLIDSLHDMYTKDINESKENEKQYVDLTGSLDPVLQDAVNLFSPETKAYIETVFGNIFPVRKDMLNDALGYRAASIGDAWTGNSRWSQKTQDTVRNMAITAFGNDAYKTLVNAEKLIHSVVSDARVTIVVKSVIVPVSNMISNVYQLVGRGVPLLNIARGLPAKTAEVEAYTKSRVRQIEAEAELRATDDPRVQRRLNVEIQTITDSHKRMSIWPLLEAGEFSGISDAGLTRAEIQLTSGRLQAYIEQAVNKMPKPLGTLGRYAIVAKDTALFKGLQKSVEYGDFLAKAVLFDDLTQRKKMSEADALARITEEFVNYDRLSGRFRGTLENLGLLWFYNFKIRSAKVAASMIRNNPVHTLLATLAPTPSMFGSVGLPTADNIFTKLATGALDNSMGPGQGMHSMMLNPWINLTQ